MCTMVNVRRSELNWRPLFLALIIVGPGDWAHFIRSGSPQLYLLSSLQCFNIIFLKKKMFLELTILSYS